MNSHKDKIQNQVSHLLTILQLLLETFSERNCELHALIERTTQKVEGILNKVRVIKKKSKQNVETNNQKRLLVFMEKNNCCILPKFYS